MVSVDQIRELDERRETLYRCLNVDQKRIELQNEEERTQEPSFSDDADKARQQLQQVAQIKSLIDDVDTIRQAVADLGLMHECVKGGRW